MAKEYLTVNGKLVTIDGKLVQVPNQEGLNDLADKNGALATQYDMLANEIENLIVNGVIDGSPRDVYDNLSALQTALPSGATGVYLTKDNGHWYFWNGTAWQDGGVYLNDTYNILNMEYVNGNITCDYNFAKEVPLYAILKNVITADISKYYVGNKEEIQETYIGEDELTYHRKELTFYFKGFGKVLVVYDELEGTTYTIEQDDIYTKDEVNSIIEEKTKILNITYNEESGVITCDYDFKYNTPNQALLEVISGDDYIYYVGNKKEIINNNVGEDDHTARDITYHFNGFGKIVIYQNDINVNEVTYTLYLEEVVATQEYVDTKIQEQITSVLEADY